jgi:hypothetical protein
MEGNNHFLTRDQILGISDIVIEDVFVPHWGGTVRVRSLTGQERGRLEVTCTERKGVNHLQNLAMVRARLVALTVVDQEGRQVFSERDVDVLNAKNADALEVIFKTALRLAGMSKADVDELTKNSESAQKEDSFFVSPSPSGAQ